MRYTRSAKTGDLKEFIFVCVCVHFFYHGRLSERTTCGGLCVFLHVYISVHWFRSTDWTKAQRSKWISASLRRVSSSTKANIASIFHASLSIFLFSFFPCAQCASSFHMGAARHHMNTQINLKLDYYTVIIYIFTYFALHFTQIWGLLTHPISIFCVSLELKIQNIGPIYSTHIYIGWWEIIRLIAILIPETDILQWGDDSKTREEEKQEMRREKSNVKIERTRY